MVHSLFEAKFSMYWVLSSSLSLAAATAAENFLEMQNPRLHPSPAKLESALKKDFHVFTFRLKYVKQDSTIKW